MEPGAGLSFLQLILHETNPSFFSFSFSLRIMMTFLGVTIYLLVDVIVYPHRTDASARQAVLQCTELTTNVFEKSAAALRTIMNSFELKNVCDEEVGHKAGEEVGDVAAEECLEEVKQGLIAADAFCNQLGAIVKQQSAQLLLGVHEPEIWHR